jgi:hypothetical protein
MKSRLGYDYKFSWYCRTKPQESVWLQLRNEKFSIKPSPHPRDDCNHLHGQTRFLVSLKYACHCQLQLTLTCHSNCVYIKGLCHLGYNTKYFGENRLMFWRKISIPSSESKSKPNKNTHKTGSQQNIKI